MISLAGKTVLVTGATGFIGGHLLDRLRKVPGVRLILLSRSSEPCLASGDIWVRSALDQLTRETWANHGIKEIDVIFHFGAFIPKRSIEGDKIDEVYRDNLIGTRALLESLPCIPERFVFSSSVDVYSKSDTPIVLTEESSLGPTNLYGASKLFCEQLIRAYSSRSGCAYAILRFGHIYGPGEGLYVKLIPQVIRAMLINETPVIYGDGTTLRDFMFVGDAVEATMRAATVDQKKIDALNIVSGHSKTINEFVSLLAEASDFSGRIEYRAGAPGGISLIFSAKKMFETLGQWKLTPLQAGLLQEVNYFREYK